MGKEGAKGKGECIPGPKRRVRPASPAQCWALGAGPPGAPLKPWGGAPQPLPAAAPSKRTPSARPCQGSILDPPLLSALPSCKLSLRSWSPVSSTDDHLHRLVALLR